MPPTLAGLHRLHPVLVFPTQGDIRHISVGRGADLLTSIPLAAQLEGT